MNRLLLCAASLSFLLSTQANSAAISVISSSADATRCKASGAVSLTRIEETANPGIGSSNTYDSTTCGNDAGNGNYWYGGNDHPHPDEEKGNFGLRNDGFMNMSTSTLKTLRDNAGANIIDGYGYSDFIRESDLQALGTNYDLHKNGKKFEYPDNFNEDEPTMDDPGWIKLGEVRDFPGDQTSTRVKDSFLTDILEITFSEDNLLAGTWSLTIKTDAIGLAEGILGRPAVFDHLSLVLKTSTKVGIYDFNFNDIFGTPVVGPNGVGTAGDGFETDFNYSTPYTFYGNWSTADLGGQGLSHWAIYARDPSLGVQAVPAPASILLALLASAGLVFRSAKRKQKS